MNDLIRRQDAIDAIDHYLGEVKSIQMGTAFKEGVKDGYCRIRSIIMSLPSAQLEESKVIRCKDCVKHNKGHGYYPNGTVIGIKDCCPLVEIRGIAQGHEFDYQYCAYAERRTNE